VLTPVACYNLIASHIENEGLSGTDDKITMLAQKLCCIPNKHEMER